MLLPVSFWLQPVARVRDWACSRCFWVLCGKTYIRIRPEGSRWSNFCGTAHESCFIRRVFLFWVGSQCFYSAGSYSCPVSWTGNCWGEGGGLVGACDTCNACSVLQHFLTFSLFYHLLPTLFFFFACFRLCAF